MKFKIVYADELYKVQKEMNALLIDIRTREEYDRSHIALYPPMTVAVSKPRFPRYLASFMLLPPCVQ